MKEFHKTKSLFVIALIICWILLALACSPVQGRTIVGNGTLEAPGSKDTPTPLWEPLVGKTVGLELMGNAHSGKQALMITGRKLPEEGAKQDLTMLIKNKQKYLISAWINPVNKEDSYVVSIEWQIDGALYRENVVAKDLRPGEWAKLEAPYLFKYSGNLEKVWICLESRNSTGDFIIDDIAMYPVTTTAKKGTIGIEKNIPSLKEVFKDKFFIGAAVATDQLESKPHTDLLKKHFSSVTAENAMKPTETQPIEGKFTFDQADKLVAFAEANGIQVRGHTLVWYSQVPDWFFIDSEGKAVTREVLLARMKTHINAVMGRYKGKIYAWDVVNEAIDANQPLGLQKNHWLEIIGPDYIEMAFRFAAEADPGAKLFYNDFAMTDPQKKLATITMLKGLLDKGVKIDGIGLQDHVSLRSPTAKALDQAIKDYAALGLEIHITEFDMSVYDSNTESLQEPTYDMMADQGYRMKELMDVYVANADVINSVTFWGMGDDHTWLDEFPVVRKNWPLIFDEYLKAKPMYWGMVDASKLPIRHANAKSVNAIPLVDGKAEESWELAESLLGMESTGGKSADIRTLWDDKYLYVFGSVIDSTGIKGDKIILLCDENNDKDPKKNADDKILTIALDSPNIDGGKIIMTQTEKGYDFELALPFTTKRGQKGLKLGFDIGLQDGTDKKQIWWNDRSHNQKSSADWGVLNFTLAPRIATAISGTPTIDGKIESFWEKAKPVHTETFTQGISGEENKFNGAIAACRMAWDDTYLYVLAEVKDAVLSDISGTEYMQDSVEIFIDENNGKTEAYEKDDAQYRISISNKVTYGSTSGYEGFKSAVIKTATGYIVELQIPFRNLKPKADLFLGFDLQVNDDQGSGKRDSIAKWNDPTNNSWMSTTGWGVIKLSGK